MRSTEYLWDENQTKLSSRAAAAGFHASFDPLFPYFYILDDDFCSLAGHLSKGCQ